MSAPASLDIELYRPTAAEHGVLGVASVGAPVGDVRAVVVTHYSHDPLVLLQEDGIGTAVVRNRAVLHLGGAWQPHRYVGFEAGIPIVVDFSSELPERAGDPAGMGDLRLTGLFTPPLRGPVQGALRLELAAPIGSRSAWKGEEGARFSPALAGQYDWKALRFVADAGAVFRPPVETTEGLEVGTDLFFDVGAGVDIAEDTVRASLAITNRVGLVQAAWATEIVAGLEAWPLPSVGVHALVGRGITTGYGAPDLRVGVGVTVVRRRPPPPAQLAFEYPDLFALPPELPDAVADAERPTPGAPPAPPPARARVKDDQIVLLENIQFELGTATLLPRSIPVLREVAGILKARPDIVQLVIEGHASEEGDFRYNYALSLSRSSAVFEQLVLAGVHPDRLSCRSQGEVRAATADIAENRRVVFHIARWLKPGEALPAYTSEILLPWSGEAAHVDVPPPPPPPEPPPPPPAPPLLLEEDE